MITDLNEILVEWSYRTSDGKPDVKNSAKLIILESVLNDFGWSREARAELLNTLMEADIVTKIGGSGSPYTVKNFNKEKHKLVKKNASDDEIAKATKKKVDKEKSKDSGANKTLKTFNGNIDKILSDLNDNKKKIVQDSLEKISIIYDNKSSDDDKKEAAQWLVDNAGFSANKMPSTGKRKAYLNKLGGDRKVLGNGTKGTEELVQKVESLLGPLQEFDASSVKIGFSAAAKPDLGNENMVKPSQDKGVADYFGGHKVLQKIRPNLHGLFGVKDENGKVKMPSSEHSKDYLAQSVNNPALQNTIDYAKEQIKNGTIDEGVLSSIEDHQKRMQDVLNDYEIPSEEAKQAIADSYNDLMVGLHKADSDIANSIMKQLAENNLYEQELANGEEVYLPSAGNFPAGDKIKGGTLEKVSLISCKFGKAGRVYGCPANSKTICELHQDKSKQNNQGQYLGEDGYTLLINDNLIRGANKEETKSKTKSFIEKTLSEVDLGDTFSEEETSEISSVVSDYMEEVDKIKEETKDESPVSRRWKLFGQKLKEIEKDYKEKLGGIVTEEHAASLIGKNNAKNLVQSGGVKVEAFMSAIEIANNIRTNESLNDLEHNKQFYDENDEPKFVTSKGTQNPDDYSITFRTKRTAGRTGGGCQLSFTGDGKAAPTDLTDDGLAIDAETGKVKEV